MHNDKLLSLLCRLPRHNAAPAEHTSAVADVAKMFTADEIQAGIAECEASIRRNDGIEFGDTRARYQAGRKVVALREALALVQA